MKLEEHIFQSASLIALIDEAVESMINTPMVSVPPEERFSGGGVYALYYKGAFPLQPKAGTACLSGMFIRAESRPGEGARKIQIGYSCKGLE